MSVQGLTGMAVNAGLLLTLVVIYDALGLHRKDEYRLARELITGLLIGAVTVTLILSAWRLFPGVVFDTRSVALALGGLFFGTVPVVVAAVVAALVRVALGGIGTAMGVAVIGTSAGIGLAWRHLRRRRLGAISLPELYLFGILVHVTMLACTVLLPSGVRGDTLRAIGVPVLVVYPVATALVGWVLKSSHLRREGEAAARELASTRERLAAMIEAAPVAIVALDAAARVTEWSPGAERMFGWRREEVLGRTNPITPESELAMMDELNRSALAGEPVRGMELDRQHKDGSSLRVRLSNAAIRDGRGEAVGVVGVLEDVTERSVLEAHLRQAQKMEAIGRLAGGIAHDFNNLLQGLLSSTQALRVRGAGASVEDFLSDVERNVRRGVALARQLLLFSRRSPGRRGVVDLGRLVSEHAELLKRLLPVNIAVELDLAADAPRVEADPGQLDQVLTNLVVNARDAMPDGGQVRISVARRDGLGVLAVRDTGHGVPVELRERIFDPFFTTKAQGQGTGLGLAVVWGIVNEHGGRVELESEPGAGACFRVLLPEVAAEETWPLQVGETPVSRASRGERVLLVEDEDATREGLVQLLSVLGYRVVAAASGDEARRLAGGTAFDLLLTDYLLPGITGLELADELCVRRPELKVVVMSGYAPGVLGRDLVDGERYPFLQKPFDMTTLARALDEVLSS